MASSRRFHLQRHRDITGVSGTGIVALGVLWPDGTASVRWLGDRPSTVFWDSMDDAEAVHGHGGATEIVWDDPEPTIVSACQSETDMSPEAADALQALAAVARSQIQDCPHCPDGHTPPDGGSQPWGAYVGPERDGDGQPTSIHVARSGGAHVAESDAQWVRDRLNPNTPKES
ncbi:hypothetical protein [Streptomyces sp. NPDC088925]|uniref:hypothetical protein n=1 Tax=Streptomyces sp. NPDC088925 TaxID=3365914 RepID=UPI003807D28E